MNPLITGMLQVNAKEMNANLRFTHPFNLSLLNQTTSGTAI